MSHTESRPYAVFLLRLGLGVLFIAHALLKLLVYTLPGTAAFFESVGVPGPLAYPVFLTELLGGSLLVLGLYTRWAALAHVPVMLGATTVHWPNGWVFAHPSGGWEFTVFVALACLALFLLGEDGAFALSARSGASAHREPGRA